MTLDEVETVLGCDLMVPAGPTVVDYQEDGEDIQMTIKALKDLHIEANGKRFTIEFQRGRVSALSSKDL